MSPPGRAARQPTTTSRPASERVGSSSMGTSFHPRRSRGRPEPPAPLRPAQKSSDRRRCALMGYSSGRIIASGLLRPRGASAAELRSSELRSSTLTVARRDPRSRPRGSPPPPREPPAHATRPGTRHLPERSSGEGGVQAAAEGDQPAGTGTGLRVLRAQPLHAAAARSRSASRDRGQPRIPPVPGLPPRMGGDGSRRDSRRAGRSAPSPRGRRSRR
jgi:hypothetical protein